MNLVLRVYRLTGSFPGDENYGLISQMRRAAISIPANIAEGWARNSPAEFNQFLAVSLGSAAELETLLELAHGLGYLKTEDDKGLSDGLGQLRGGLICFKSTLRIQRHSS